MRTATRARRDPGESTTVDLSFSPAEPQLQQATRLAPRGGRSEHDRELLRTPRREIEELIPRGQALADSQAREALRKLDLEARVAALLPPAVEMDPRKLFIVDFKRKFPNVKGRALALYLDNREIAPLQAWIAAAGTRLWFELWDHPKTRNAVRRYIYGAGK